MFTVVLGAIRVRRAQAATLFVLVALAAGSVAAAPWYVAAAAHSVAVADVASAQPAQFVVRVAGKIVNSPGSASRAGGQVLIQQVQAQAAAVVAIPGATATASLALPGNAYTGRGQLTVNLAYREEMCLHVTVEGSCPTELDEAMVSRRAAEQLGLRIGDRFTYEYTDSRPTLLRVAGIYQLRDPLGRYWAGSELGAAPRTETASMGTADTVFVSPETLATQPAQEFDAAYHLVLPDEVFLPTAGYDLATGLAHLAGREGGSQWRVQSDAGTLVERVARGQRLVNLGVSIAAAQLLILCWFALFFAIRHTAEQRRPDLGLLKLRGSAPWLIWLLTVLQSVLPVLAGALVGAAAGLGVPVVLADNLGDRAELGVTAVLSVSAAAVALAGALIAAVAADSRGMSIPVLDLLRQGPVRRRGWRADAVDLVVVTVCVAAIYQAYAADPEPGGASGLVLLTPALIAVAIALVAARAVTPLARRAGRHALRAGRLPVALVAAHLSRRSGTHRMFALLAVAVALLTTSIAAWDPAAEARASRAVQEVGADRVLTVQARHRAHLLTAVRAADPTGRYAMAVVRNSGVTGQVMLAVDSARLPSVAAWQPGYDTSPITEIAALLRPEAPPVVRVGDGDLRLDAARVGGDQPLLVVAHLATAGGDPVAVPFGPIAAGRGSYRSALAGCGAPDGCRLVGFELATQTPSGGRVTPEANQTVQLFGLANPRGSELIGSLLSDVTRWRGPLQAVVGPTVAAHDDRLTLTSPPGATLPGAARSGWTYVVDAPVPAPVVLTGPASGFVPGDPRLQLFGNSPLPVRIVDVVDVLPQVVGRGYLVDLEYADRLAVVPGNADVPQVWLAPDAPAALVGRLRAQGLVVLSQDSIGAATDRLDRQGPPWALRFQVLSALIGLMLAAGALTVTATVERPGRLAELAALRVQGLAASAVRTVAYAGYAVLVLCCVAIGIAASAITQAMTRSGVPVFIDDWQVLPVPGGPNPYPVVLAAGVALLTLGVTAAAAATQLVRAVRDRFAGTPARPRQELP